jgi:hypothetical protein
MTSCRACGAMISTDAITCARCGARFNGAFVTLVGFAAMLGIAVFYALLERYW